MFCIVAFSNFDLISAGIVSFEFTADELKELIKEDVYQELKNAEK